MKKVNVVVVNLSTSNYFAMLDIKQEFDIDQSLLYQNYIKLQQYFHPDKAANKTNAEKLLAMEYSAKLNDAYQTLKDDKKRAEYLLSLVNIIINREDNNLQADPLMLNEMLDLSEAIIEANNTELESIKKDILIAQKECVDNFKQFYNEAKYTDAAQAVVKLQYLQKMMLNSRLLA